ncbi:RAB7A-interacting MON1-CCZ1 complex subunit 1 isoform X2 [Spea bombifrons]|uniref:RAB7A-interacting MON1-CCZ1 complex subunit 1 isoform X2 n=1 Tax=Spea bombifrons TaxID=233779 RepID=UPI0023491076|nr:RAB7A-interacting MON1-CCZ1 complex subunit 1 isoform X2 [Spea bombifrons]
MRSWRREPGKAILDITFFEENRLVDEDFLRDESLDEVKQLIDLLSDPERLVEEVNQHQEGSDVTLEVDVLECLHWRRGALLYMFCHTVGERECWILQNKKTFQQCLQDGVFHLLRMLRTRNPLVINHEVSFHDLSTANLLSNGIFSDIHLLALMYCGEMCYWALKYCSDGQSSNSNTGCESEPRDQSQDRLIPFQKVGEDTLEKYVSVCEGPLGGQGWNTDKAKDILKFLKEDSL